jgi:truncated hemoglobin YjbI
MGTMTTSAQERTFYDAVGGHQTFVRLVETFYAGVASDPVLRAIYPEEDLGPAEVRFRMFLEQYWGGPTTYSENRGHPRLGQRHAPFAVTPHARDRWLTHMRAALEESDMSDEHKQQFWEYVVRAAHFLVNTPDDVPVETRQRSAPDSATSPDTSAGRSLRVLPTDAQPPTGTD